METKQCKNDSLQCYTMRSFIKQETEKIFLFFKSHPQDKLQNYKRHA